MWTLLIYSLILSFFSLSLPASFRQITVHSFYARKIYNFRASLIVCSGFSKPQHKPKIKLILKLIKTGDQALISISTTLKFSTLKSKHLCYANLYCAGYPSSREPPYSKDSNVWFTTVPFKPLFDQTVFLGLIVF